MPVPSTLVDISTTASSNSPQGSDLIGNTLDEYLRSTQAILKTQFVQGADIASATTLALLADGSNFDVTGTTTVTGISSTNSWDGRTIILKFDGSLILTHNASTFILPWASNITTTAGDSAVFRQEESGVWRCLYYQFSYTQTFTPTLFNITNVSSSSVDGVGIFQRSGNVVNGSLRINIAATATGAIQLDFSLPIASAFTDNYDAIGTSTSYVTNSTPQIGGLNAETTNDRISLNGYAIGTPSRIWFVNFWYIVK